MNRARIIAQFKTLEAERDRIDTNSTRQWDVDLRWNLTQRMAQLQRMLGAWGVDHCRAISEAVEEAETLNAP